MSQQEFDPLQTKVTNECMTICNWWSTLTRAHEISHITKEPNQCDKHAKHWLSVYCLDFLLIRYLNKKKK